MKKTLYIVGAIIILVGLFLILSKNEKEEVIVLSDYKNVEYVIEGQRVKLTDGSASSPQVGSESKIVTTYFGNEVHHDLNDDGREDVVFILTQNTGGSGTFYYVVAALNTPEGYIGSQGLLLGDRIAPQTTEINEEAGRVNVIVVNYADRKPGESFTVVPSVGKSIWLKLDPNTMQFGEVEQNFEGEANPSSMSLSMKKWTWIEARYNDGRVVKPSKAQAFTLTFEKSGRFSATTDCNGVGGEYSATKDTITFSNMMMTLMFCEGSEESVFTKLLSDSQSYHFTSKGELILDFKFDSGSVLFR